MGYSNTDDLFRSWLHLAEPGADGAGSIAGNGNRTRMASLEGWNFTIKLCPRSELSCRDRSQLPSPFSGRITQNNARRQSFRGGGTRNLLFRLARSSY